MRAASAKAPAPTGRLLLAIAAAAVVVVAAPFVGEIRAAVERALPGQYLSIVLGAVLLPLAVVVGVALLGIRERRALRYGLLVAAVGLAVIYATVMQTTPTEQFHFTEYGLVSFLFYRAWHSRADVSVLVLPLCASVIAGFADEWFQWFVPSRVGEARDVVLNAVGGICGLMVGVALDPPAAVAWPVNPPARRVLATGVAAALGTAAVFLYVVHLGHDVNDAEAGSFRSRYAPHMLRLIGSDRAARWRLAPPPSPAPLLSREDHYLSEALFHVEYRNLAVSRGDMRTAWRENLILEKYYAPVLDAGSPGSRWPAEQRAAVARVAESDSRPYASQAYPFPVYTWSGWAFWAAAAVIVLATWLTMVVGPRRRIERAVA